MIGKKKLRFIFGMARALDLGNTVTLNKYSYRAEAEKIDCNALKSDWTMVGKDIELAITKYQKGTSWKIKKKS